MRGYELTLILDPSLEEKQQKILLENIKKEFSKVGGEVVKEEIWGKKNLAYPIAKRKEGVYVFWQVKLEPSFLGEIEKRLHLEEKILRYLFIRGNGEAVTA